MKYLRNILKWFQAKPKRCACTAGTCICEINAILGQARLKTEQAAPTNK